MRAVQDAGQLAGQKSKRIHCCADFQRPAPATHPLPPLRVRAQAFFVPPVRARLNVFVCHVAVATFLPLLLFLPCPLPQQQVVAALDLIIEKYQEHIAPHASALTQQLTRCFLEYASVRRQEESGRGHKQTHSGRRRRCFLRAIKTDTIHAQDVQDR